MYGRPSWPHIELTSIVIYPGETAAGSTLPFVHQSLVFFRFQSTAGKTSITIIAHPRIIITVVTQGC